MDETAQATKAATETPKSMEETIRELFTPDNLIDIATQAATVIAIFVIGWIVSKWVRSLTLRAVRRAKVDEALSRFFASIAQYAVLIFAITAALGKAGIETTSVAAVIAAAGLAVGLALQGSLGNFASGVLLLFFRPFTIGDRVTAAGYTGQVEDIGLFATTISTPADERIILPNSTVTGDAITNHTAAGKVRDSIEAGVAYGADIDQVCKILVEAAEASEHVLNEPAPASAFIEMAASSLNFVVHCWTEPANLVDMQHNVKREIYNRLNEAGIEIPFNQMVVHRAPED